MLFFVKRKSKNDSIKKVSTTTPVPPNSPEETLRPPPPVYQKPALEMSNFLDMYANGGFVNRRKYY